MPDEKIKEPDYIGHRARIRQRFLLGDGRDMEDYELLELLLTIAIPRKDVKPIAKELIRKFGDFSGVISAPVNELMLVPGIKENSAVALKLVKAGAIRLSWQVLNNSDIPVLGSWDQIIDYCRALIANCPVEEFHIIYLNSKLRVIGSELHQKGTVNQVSAHPREIIKSAIAKNAKGIILVHNHPSGDTKPSEADIVLTRQTVDTANAIGLKVIDHLIIGKNSIFSFHDAGYIKYPEDEEKKVLR